MSQIVFLLMYVGVFGSFYLRMFTFFLLLILRVFGLYITCTTLNFRLCIAVYPIVPVAFPVYPCTRGTTLENARCQVLWYCFKQTKATAVAPMDIGAITHPGLVDFGTRKDEDMLY